MPLQTAIDLLDLLRRCRLVDAARLDELARAPAVEPKALANDLVRRGWLTPYQINQLFAGRGPDLLLGSYVLLEKLGEGGMGQVFKARNWKLGRVVAVKIIRKERLDNPDAVRRFDREIRAAAQLDHSHIVRALDADAVGGAHLLVMEYVEGVDLAKLVKKEGPLPVDKACDYSRQAALGLQHAHERGMVHRDIKPHNLLLTPQGMVKILDMGLARLARGGGDDEASSTMTREGAVMGTLDYIAPEQAMNSHTADIRADLYSLGCMLYFLLTGRPPFPGGEALEKLLKHRLEEPVPVERLRPDVPAGVAAVVRKLMAKRPDDRYRTPAEAATALAAAVAPPVPDPAEQTTADGDTDAALLLTHERRRRRAAEQRQRIASYAVGGILSLGLAGLFVVLFLRFGLPAAKPPLDPPLHDGPGFVSTPPVRAVPFDEWLKETAALSAEKQAKAVGEELKRRNPDFDGQVKADIEDGAVVGLEFDGKEVRDLTPVQALRWLNRLKCRGVGSDGKLADLSPLKGLPLTRLDCGLTGVTTLAPLRGMPLTDLVCDNTNVTDLTPLAGMKLTRLGCSATHIADLSPLRGMPLTDLGCGVTQVRDLSPLEGMKLVAFSCDQAQVADFSLLRAMPLKLLWLDFRRWRRDAELLRAIPTLQQINGKQTADFWKDVEAQQAAFDAWCKQVAAMKPDEQIDSFKAELKRSNINFDGRATPAFDNGRVVGLTFGVAEVGDLSPLRALPGLAHLTCHGSGPATSKLNDLSPLKGLSLTTLDCVGTAVWDLSPLHDMPLTYLECNGTNVADLTPLHGLKLDHLGISDTHVTDLAPLRGAPLTYLHVNRTAVKDLAPLVGMRLTGLEIDATGVTDLSPLRGMPLTFFACRSTPVTDLTPLQKTPLQQLLCDFDPKRDTEVLRSIPTLQTINDRPAAEVLKEAGDALPKP